MSEELVKRTGFTHADLAQSTLQVMLKGIPYIGEPLHQFIFGSLEEARWRRLEDTLREVGEAVRGPAHIDTEDFVVLLQHVAPRVACETSERRRQFFRDLLINAATVQPGSPRWADANLAADMISEIDPPGLALLAGVSRYPKNDNANISADPFPHTFNGRTLSGQEPKDLYRLDYGWTVIAEWVWRLKERRLLGLGSTSGRGFTAVQLTDLGDFLVEWGMR